MSVQSRGKRRELWIEYAFIPLIVAGLANTVWFFYKFGFLPQPYFYEPNGTFTDWFSLAYWARHTGAYDVERTIYPPLSFLVMGLFGDDKCYQVEGLEARFCDWEGIAAICGFYTLAVVLIAWTYFRLDRRSGFPRAFALGFGLPLTYALERGNTIILCLICMLLAYGPIVRSARLRWLFAGLAVNFKIYVIAAVLAPLLRRRWVAVEGTVLATILTYVVTWYLFGSGSPIQLFYNVTTFGSGFSAGNPNDLWYASSYQPALAALRGTTLPILTFLGSRLVEQLEFGLQFYVRFSQLAVLCAALAIWLRPEVVPTHRAVFFALALALMTSESGGYTQILLLPFVFMERWRGITRPAAILIAYILCIPIEYVFSPLPSGIVRDSFLSGRYVTVYYGLGISSLLRPGLVQLISTLLAALTIRDVWADIRDQGWQARWRFRHDWPVVPWVRRPQPTGKESALHGAGHR